jgi:plastocyanin
VTGCGGGDGRPAAAPAPVTVEIRLYAFSPKDVTVDAGQPVTWVERDEDLEGNGAHSVIATDKSFDSGLVKQGAAFTFTPTKAGTISYYCGVHNYMTGTVTVR